MRIESARDLRDRLFEKTRSLAVVERLAPAVLDEPISLLQSVGDTVEETLSRVSPGRDAAVARSDDLIDGVSGASSPSPRAMARMAAAEMIGGSGDDALVSRVAKPPTPKSLDLVSFGVGRNRDSGAFQLSVRYQVDSPAVRRLLQEMHAETRGEIDIRYTGKVKPLAAEMQNRRRPLHPGLSIGHFAVTAGTLGCFVETTADGGPLILSNNHVLANTDAGAPGDPILQPGAQDGGATPSDEIASLLRFAPLGGGAAEPLDAALARPSDATPLRLDYLWSLMPLDPDIIDGTDEAAYFEDMAVKIGRTTDMTFGRVTSAEHIQKVGYGGSIGTVTFRNQLEIEGHATNAFARAGDSGSLILSARSRPMGLLFAGSVTGGHNNKGLTFAHPIASVLDYFSARIVT